MNIGRRLAEGVGAWLQFETHCNRAGLFSEKYLSNSIGQILGAVYGSGVIAEYLHETLAAQMKGRGKRPRLDFGVVNADGETVVVVESKWIGKTKPNVVDIIWDILRLEMIVAQSNLTRAFFVLAGKKQKLSSFFESTDFRGPKGDLQRRPILSYKGGGRYKLPLRPIQHFRVPLLRQLFARESGVIVPEEVFTKRFKPFPENCINKQYQVFVWEVLNNPDRTTFDPQTSPRLKSVIATKKWHANI